MASRAQQHLRTSDPRFGEWIDRLGPLKFPKPQEREPFIALLETIAHQQLAGAAARSIWSKVLSLFEAGIPCPKRLLEMSEVHLRGAGLSRSKALAMRDICTRVNAGSIPGSASIKKMPDADIYAELLQIRGVGTWTVDMLMMFTLRRPDVMPITDYGVRKGLQVLYRKRSLPTPKQVEKLAEKWHPYRSTAALYLWRIADSAAKTKTKRSLAKKIVQR